MRLGLVALLVPSYDDGIAFFVGGLGFDLIEDRPITASKRWVVVAPPDGGAALLLAKAVGEQQRSIGNQAGGRVGFFLYSHDFVGDQAKIEAAGGMFEETPRDEPYGKVAVFRDPFGNRWDLIEPIVEPTQTR